MEVTLEQILNAREDRAYRQQAMSRKHRAPILSFTMNIPGPVKDTPLIRRAFQEGLNALALSVRPEAILDKCKEVVIDDVSYYKISSYKILEADGQFCMIIPINIMMTQRYMDIMHLFELDITKFERVEDIVTPLAHMVHNLIPILSTHGEILIGHHLRSVDNKLLRPNWLVPDQKYQIMRLKTVLQNTESFTTALAFEQTKHHLLHTIFDERNAIKRVGVRSFHDYMFGEEYAI